MKLERGAFLSDSFGVFASKVVLFLHVTSKTKDEPHPNLLTSVMGKQSWPSLAFLDAEKKVLARARDRSVQGLETVLVNLGRRGALRKKAAGGDAQAKRELFLFEFFELDALSFTQASTRFKAIAKFTLEDRSRIETKLVALEVNHVRSLHRNDRDAAARAFIKMLEAGRTPKNASAAYSFWSTILYAAGKAKNVGLYERGVAGFEKVFGSDAGMKAVVTDYRRKLERLKAAK